MVVAVVEAVVAAAAVVVAAVTVVVAAAVVVVAAEEDPEVEGDIFVGEDILYAADRDNFVEVGHMGNVVLLVGHKVASVHPADPAENKNKQYIIVTYSQTTYVATYIIIGSSRFEYVYV